MSTRLLVPSHFPKRLAIAAASISLMTLAVILFVLRLDNEQSRETPTDDFGATTAWQRSNAVAASPQWLPLPEKTLGDTWSSASFVTNLADLDLVAAVQTEHGSQPGIALVDVHSGQTVAQLQFTAGSLFVRLRTNPRQLLVSEGDRLLVYSLLGKAPELADEIALPNRLGYPWFINAMILSENERFLYFPQRAKAELPACEQPVFDAQVCDRDAVGVVDLANLSYVASIPLPHSACAILIRRTGADGATVQCGSDIQPIGPAGVTGSLKHLEAVPKPNARDEVYSPRVPYAVLLSDGSLRALSQDGLVLDGGRNPLALDVLPAGEQVYGTPWQLAGGLVAALTEPVSGGDLEHLVLVDLNEGRTVYAIPLPAGTVWATTVDNDRILLLTRDGLRGHLVQVDATSGALVQSVALDPSTSPDAIDH